MKFKIYDEIKPKLYGYKELYGKQQKLEGHIEVAEKML